MPSAWVLTRAHGSSWINGWPEVLKKEFAVYMPQTALFCKLMSLFVTSLNSGSNGNCYYVGNEHEAVLIDAGISCRETEKRMKRLGLKIELVKAIFISHEHGDHIRGVESIASKHKLPVYITPATLRHSKLRIDSNQVHRFRAYENVTIGDLSILAFPKQHDAIDPHSFVISAGGTHIGVFTDIGTACADVIDNFKKCHAIFLEANYDEVMLERGRYPYHLKKRISGNEGHLSNKQALDLFMAHRPAFMSHVFLSHLSQDNNSPEVALDLFHRYAAGTEVIVASRYEETAVYTITGSPLTHATVQHPRKTKSVQISLF